MQTIEVDKQQLTKTLNKNRKRHQTKRQVIEALRACALIEEAKENPTLPVSTKVISSLAYSPPKQTFRQRVRELLLTH